VTSEWCYSRRVLLTSLRKCPEDWSGVVEQGLLKVEGRVSAGSVRVSGVNGEYVWLSISIVFYNRN
jgi:hypothetical protein